MKNEKPAQPAAQEVEPSAPAAEEQRLANLEHNRKFDEAVDSYCRWSKEQLAFAIDDLVTQRRAFNPQDWADPICGACQLMDAWKNAAPEEWSEWDQQQRDGLSAILKKLYALADMEANNGKLPLPTLQKDHQAGQPQAVDQVMVRQDAEVCSPDSSGLRCHLHTPSSEGESHGDGRIQVTSGITPEGRNQQSNEKEIDLPKLRTEGRNEGCKTSGLADDSSLPVVQVREVEPKALSAPKAPAGQMEEEAILQVKDQRDELEEFVGDLALELGCPEEWTNLHDHKRCVMEAVHGLQAHLIELRGEAPAPAGLDLEAVQRLIAVIESAGLLNLSNGVQLGPTVWYVKAHEAVEAVKELLARHLGSGEAE